MIKVIVYFISKLKRRQIKALAKWIYLSRSNLFDASWYVSKYPEVLESDFPPAAHYLEVGWRKGLDPSEGFSTTAYLQANPAVRRASSCPLVHFLLHGSQGNVELDEQFGSWQIELGRLLFARKIKKNQGVRILVHLHVFYSKMWPAVRRYLECLESYGFDLIVTYPHGFVGPQALHEIRADFPRCKIIEIPNRGFDVGPFVEVLSMINLDDYDIVYHLHTKSVSSGVKGRFAYGKYFRGADWFRQLYDGCLGPFNVHRAIGILKRDPSVSLVAAKNLIFNDMPHRRAYVRRYAEMMGIDIPEDYSFIGGFCFAARASALKKIAALGVRIADFGQSQRALFTLGHALERLIPIMLTEPAYRLKALETRVPKHPFWRVAQKMMTGRKVRKAIKIARRLGFKEVKQFGIDTRSGLKLAFLDAEYNGHRVFVKYGGAREIVANEGRMQSVIHGLLPENVPAVRAYDAENRFVAMDMVDGFNLDMLLQTGFTAEEKAKILADLKKIREKLIASGYLHRDIMPANFIWNGRNLSLVDFQFMVEVDKDTGRFEELKYLVDRPAVRAGLGNIYRKPGEGWDDDYSFDRVVEFVEAIRVMKPDKAGR